MSAILVYNKHGEVINILVIPTDIYHVGGRTSSDGKVFYKGVGVDYKQHAVLQPSPDERVIGTNPVFYYGQDVENLNFIGKSGIFQQPYQPYFSDFIGGCGPKEISLVGNSAGFKFSAVSVVDKIDWDKENLQSYYILNYPFGREDYTDNGSPTNLLRLIRYMLDDGWNFPWDKTAIRDISSQGRIHDLADMFKSTEVTHQLGTVYSILYSLRAVDEIKYNEFTKYCGLAGDRSVSDVPFFALSILKENGIDVEMPATKRADIYIHTIGNILLCGRNCAAVEDVKKGDSVKEQYLSRFWDTVSEDKKELRL